MPTLTQADIAFIADPWPPQPERRSLIFIHGSAMSKSFWQAQIRPLSGSFNILAPDLPGHGDSPGQGFDDMTAYAEAVLAWLEAVNPPGPVLCGLSLGGAVAQHLLIHHPERFEAGILINTGARLRVLPLIFEAIEKNFEDFKNMLKTAGVSAINQTPAMGELIYNQVQCQAAVATGDFKACDAFDVIAQLPGIQAPVLVISGNDDTTTPPKYAAYLADNIPDARLVTIADAAHLAPLEQPQAVNTAIAAFMNDLPAFSA